MSDFMSFKIKNGKNGTTITPVFDTTVESDDILVKGKTLYGFWDKANGKWISKWERTAAILDREIMEFAKKYKEAHPEESVIVELLKDDDNRLADRLLNYIKKTSDTQVAFNSKMVFGDQEIKKEDYCTIKAKYKLEDGNRDNYNKLISTLYDPEERHKIEWLIGAVIAGENLNVQKFGVMYGPPKSGKSTILEIIYKLFDGYYATFNSKEVGKGDSFALSAFKKNPLVAVDAEGDLSKIDSNTTLNTLTAHDIIKINEKYQAKFDLRPLAIIFICTNSPVKITDSKSGLLRRLIDINPSGRLLPSAEYKRIMKAIPFELGSIAYHCKEVYLEDPDYYENYRPTEMFEETNDFYDFMLTYYNAFVEDNPTVLKVAWARYKEYIEECGYSYKMNMHAFKNELKEYFRELELQGKIINANGVETHVSNIYRGFKTELFKKSRDTVKRNNAEKDINNTRSNSGNICGGDGADPDIYEGIPDWLRLSSAECEDKEALESNPLQSIFKDAHAQYATTDANEVPKRAWKDKNGNWNVASRLKDILPNQVHYVLTQDVEPSLIVIDFDKKGEDGKKSLRENLTAAKSFPKTYAEVSKGGQGLHLHYIYDGDVDELSRLYDDNIEIKVFKGLSALRRRLTLCNNCKIAHINSGLPLRGDRGRKDVMIDWNTVKNEKAIRTLIRRNMAKEYHADTTSSIHFIKKILDEAYDSGETYDVRDLRNAVMNFAASASNQAQHCMEVVMGLEFCSKDISENEIKEANEAAKAAEEEKPIVFYDIEVMPNLFVVCYKKQGPGGKEACVKMINPTGTEIAALVESSRLIGFNNRNYDNHLIYARILGYTNEQIFSLSSKLIKSKKNNEEDDGPGFHGFREAYKLSYTDVYDFSSKKQSLKKWEIELGIHHQELGLPWDKPVPEELWDTVADYCCNDVVATEATFNHLKTDWEARQILADISGGSVNDTTNQLSLKLVFGNVKKPKLIYTDLATGKQYESIGGCYKGE